MTSLAQRLKTQQKKRLSRILGVPISMTAAAALFSKSEGLYVTRDEVAEYFDLLKARKTAELTRAKRSGYEPYILRLRAQMWWLNQDDTADTSPSTATTEDHLKAENARLIREVAYYKGVAEAYRFCIEAFSGKGTSK